MQIVRKSWGTEIWAVDRVETELHTEAETKTETEIETKTEDLESSRFILASSLSNVSSSCSFGQETGSSFLLLSVTNGSLPQRLGSDLNSVSQWHWERRTLLITTNKHYWKVQFCLSFYLTIESTIEWNEASDFCSCLAFCCCKVCVHWDAFLLTTSVYSGYQTDPMRSSSDVRGRTDSRSLDRSRHDFMHVPFTQRGEKRDFREEYKWK